jgi:arylsulfatase A-like enzyme
LRGRNTFPHFAAGWAVAGDAPFTGTKQVASNFGGTRSPPRRPLPKRIKAKGEVRAQFHHVIDVARPSSRRPACPSPRW